MDLFFFRTEDFLYPWSLFFILTENCCVSQKKQRDFPLDVPEQNSLKNHFPASFTLTFFVEVENGTKEKRVPSGGTLTSFNIPPVDPQFNFCSFLDETNKTFFTFAVLNFRFWIPNNSVTKKCHMPQLFTGACSDRTYAINRTSNMTLTRGIRHFFGDEIIFRPHLSSPSL